MTLTKEQRQNVWRPVLTDLLKSVAEKERCVFHIDEKGGVISQLVSEGRHVTERNFEMSIHRYVGPVFKNFKFPGVTVVTEMLIQHFKPTETWLYLKFGSGPISRHSIPAICEAFDFPRLDQ